MIIRRLVASHASAYRALMLDAYALHPDAFTSSVAERAALPITWWASRLAGGPDSSQLVVGIFKDDELAGAAGLSFQNARLGCALRFENQTGARGPGRDGSRTSLSCAAKSRGSSGGLMLFISVARRANKKPTGCDPWAL